MIGNDGVSIDSANSAIDSIVLDCQDMQRQVEELRLNLAEMIEYAEEWQAHYADIWGAYRLHEQEAMRQSIKRAKSLLVKD